MKYRTFAHKCLLTALLATGLTLGVAASASSIGIGTVNTAFLNLRTSASSTASSLGMLENGVMVNVLDHSTNGWYKVSHNGLIGYMSSDHLLVATGTSISNDQSSLILIDPVPVETTQPVPVIVETPQPEATPEQTAQPETDQSDEVQGEDNQNEEDQPEEALGNGKVTLQSGSLNIRASASTSSSRLGAIPNGAVVALESYSDGWYLVSYNGITGYISKDYIQPTTEAVTAVVAATSSSTGSAIVAKAKEYLGCRYSYGKAGPNSFDCSGFTSYIYKQFGYTINRTASTQLNGNGVSVSRDNLQPGDLVFFRDYSCKKSASHVGIYIGNGQFIHASSSKSASGVKISSLSETWYANRYVGARRIV